MSSQIGGMHIIYVNAKGLATLKAGGPFPYPRRVHAVCERHIFRWRGELVDSRVRSALGVNPRAIETSACRYCSDHLRGLNQFADFPKDLARGDGFRLVIVLVRTGLEKT